MCLSREESGWSLWERMIRRTSIILATLRRLSAARFHWQWVQHFHRVTNENSIGGRGRTGLVAACFASRHGVRIA